MVPAMLFWSMACRSITTTRECLDRNCGYWFLQDLRKHWAANWWKPVSPKSTSGSNTAAFSMNTAWSVSIQVATTCCMVQCHWNCLPVSLCSLLRQLDLELSLYSILRRTDGWADDGNQRLSYFSPRVVDCRQHQDAGEIKLGMILGCILILGLRSEVPTMAAVFFC